jgi:hypothetical protein
MIMPEIPCENRHRAATGSRKLSKQTCQTAHEPDMVAKFFPEIFSCCGSGNWYFKCLCLDLKAGAGPKPLSAPLVSGENVCRG